MKPATSNPYPQRGYRMRSDAEFIAKMPSAAVHGAVTRVVTAMYPKRRGAGMLGVLIWLTCQSLKSPNGVWVGHRELGVRFGVSPRTLVRRLGAWRNTDRMIDRKMRGRRNADVTHVTWWTASNELVKAVAAELRKKSGRHTRAKVKGDNPSQSQRANLPQVAAPGSRTAGGVEREVGRVGLRGWPGKERTTPEPDKPDVPDGSVAGRAIWAAARAELEAKKLTAKLARARGRVF
jgi:hypothetical protein